MNEDKAKLQSKQEENCCWHCCPPAHLAVVVSRVLSVQQQDGGPAHMVAIVPSAPPLSRANRGQARILSLSRNLKSVSQPS